MVGPVGVMRSDAQGEFGRAVCFDLIVPLHHCIILVHPIPGCSVRVVLRSRQ